MAKFAKTHGIRVFYYISPQLWAWRSSRVKAIRRWVERMFVILPFEQEFYARYDYHVDFQGHPLLDVINPDMKVTARAEFLRINNLPDLPIIALLPGSRRMEIEKMLKIMVAAAPSFPGYQFVIAGAPSIEEDFYKTILKGTGTRVVTNQTYDLLGHSRAAMVTSGTATLETALIGVPQVVCYRGNQVSYMIARRLVHVKYISLVNLICDSTIVPELIQQELTVNNLVAVLDSLIKAGPRRESVENGYVQLRSMLGGSGASARVAALMKQYLHEK
jgi:lipid-A-disaccharide synthase